MGNDHIQQRYFQSSGSLNKIIIKSIFSQKIFQQMTKLYFFIKDKISTYVLSGAFGGFCASFVGCPGEHVKCIMQNDPKFKSPKQTAKHIYSTFGLKGIFKGMIFTIIRGLLAGACYFPTYRWESALTLRWSTPLLRSVRNKTDLILPEEISMLLAGGAAGVAYWFLSMPADVLKSRYFLCFTKYSL